MTEPFNPLDMTNLGQSIATRIVESETTALGDISGFYGAGVYAIYYAGVHPAYARLVSHNEDGRREPIYVGKAVPAGGRRGIEDTSKTRTSALSKRLKEHAGSIRAANNLDIDDFAARWLVIEDIWIPLGESALLRRHSPVWNRMVDGFGNHDPGKGRREGVRSRWDTIHPGRPWAAHFPAREESADDIAQEITTYLEQRLEP